MTDPIPADLALPPDDEAPFGVDDLAAAVAIQPDLDELRRGAAAYTPEDVVGLDPPMLSAYRVGTFVPSSDADAEFLLRLLAGAEAEQRGARLQAAAWRDRIDLWEEERVAEPARIAALVDALLVDYGRRTRSKRRAVFSLPSGRITTRAKDVGGTVEVVDDEAVASWAEEALSAVDYQAVVQTKRKVLVAPFRKLVRIVSRPVDVPDGEDPQDPPATETVVIDGAGELVPGVRVRPETVDVTVTPS